MEKGLRLLSIACGVAYFISVPWQPFSGSVVLKGLSVGSLALLAFLLSRNRSGNFAILGLALAFSSAGDVLLDLDPRRLFVSGLVCFLAAHLIYILLFVRSRRPPVQLGARAFLAILMILYSALFSAWLIPSLGSLTAPVLIYICAITGMVLSAILAGFSRPWVMIGAILFLISDSFLAAAKFKGPVPFRDFLVWATYYAGQYSIAVGYIRAVQSVA